MSTAWIIPLVASMSALTTVSSGKNAAAATQEVTDQDDLSITGSEQKHLN